MNNIDTVSEVIREYFGGLFFPILLGLAVVVFFIKGNKKERISIGVSLAVLAIICNDWFYGLCQSVGIKNEYYRFLWMVPVIPMCALFLAKLKERLQWKVLKLALIILVFAGAAYSGEHYLTKAQMALPENKYGVEDRILELVQALKDCREEEEPVILCDEFVALRIRQIDPTVRLAAGRKAYLRYARGQKQSKRMKAGLNLAHTGSVQRKKRLRKFFKMQQVDYVVLSNEIANGENMKEYGCEAVSATPDYTIFRVA